MNKPRIFAGCKAGCLWETVHKDDLYDFTGYTPLEITKAGFENFQLPLDDRKYRIYTDNKELRYVLNEDGDTVVNSFIKGDLYESSLPYFDVGPFYRKPYAYNGSDYEYYVVIDGQHILVGRDGDTGYPLLKPSGLHTFVSNVTKAYVWSESTTVVAVPHIRYSANADGEGFTETWEAGQNFIGIAVGEYAPAYKEDYTWSYFGGDASAAAVIIGEASGKMVTLDDVSPTEHVLACRLTRKNLISYPFKNTTTTMGGITFTDNGDGTITVNGPSDGTGASFELGSVTIEKSGYYYLSGTPSGGSTSTYIITGDRKKRGQSIGSFFATESGYRCELEAGETVDFYIYINDSVGTVENLLFKPQFEFGEMTNFSEYASPSGASVVACGKNLFDGTILSGYFKNVNGGLEGGTIAKFKSLLLDLPKGTYTLSFGVAAVIIRTIIDGKYDPSPVGVTNIKTYTFTTNGGKVGFSFKRNDDTAWVVNTPIQIEIGSKATEYEPFSFYEEYTADENGVANIPSVSPYMVVYPESSAFMVSATYNRDLNEVIRKTESRLDKLEESINALLGV